MSNFETMEQREGMYKRIKWERTRTPLCFVVVRTIQSYVIHIAHCCNIASIRPFIHV